MYTNLYLLPEFVSYGHVTGRMSFVVGNWKCYWRQCIPT